MTHEQQVAHDLIWAAVCQGKAETMAILGKAGTGKSRVLCAVAAKISQQAPVLAVAPTRALSDTLRHALAQRRHC